jgi:hypothetical protein
VAAQGGVPRALYADRHSIYRDDDHPEHPTQFGRAMKELEVEQILARSPQAPFDAAQGGGRVGRRSAGDHTWSAKPAAMAGVRHGATPPGTCCASVRTGQQSFDVAQGEL